MKIAAASRTRTLGTVAVLAFDGISPFHLSVPCLVFGEDSDDPQAPRIKLVVCAAEPGPIRTSAGFGIETRHGLAALSRAQTIVVPSWRPRLDAPPAALLAALRRAHRRGARIVGLCLGAFVLAEAGLLDGRPATTHWLWAQRFADRYPAVQLDAEVLYVDDGDVLTSAGTAAALDCCLHLLRQHAGAEAANRVARRLLIAPHRDGGQAQFIEQPLPESRQGERLGQLLAWVAAHPAEPHTLDGLAAKAAMSRRSFTRHFRDATGASFGPWLLAQRITHAQRLLEATLQSIDAVAAAAGFGSAAALRLHFGRACRMSPTAWRQRFRTTSA